jgi:hypothetical protein
MNALDEQFSANRESSKEHLPVCPAVERPSRPLAVFGLRFSIRGFPNPCPANRLTFRLLLCLASALTEARAQDAWESLPDVPFTYGVSAGGGLATDGTYLYAADFSGDASTDYVDLNHNGAYTAGERFNTLGIKTASVRLARFDPATGSWVALPTLNAAGVSGNAFSGGNLNGSLFHAGESLYYYQFRQGPNRCVLYRYNLAQGLSGTWASVWDLSTTAALLDVNAGVAGVDAASGPVVLHHQGGGAYAFAPLDRPHQRQSNSQVADSLLALQRGAFSPQWWLGLRSPAGPALSYERQPTSPMGTQRRLRPGGLARRHPEWH